MYGLPENIDLNFFVGRSLSSISFSEHCLILNFEGNKTERPISLHIQSFVSLQLPDGQKQEWEDFRQGAAFLVALISNTVDQVKGYPNGTLQIHFQEGALFEVFDNSESYESYQILRGDDFIVVV